MSCLVVKREKFGEIGGPSVWTLLLREALHLSECADEASDSDAYETANAYVAESRSVMREALNYPPEPTLVRRLIEQHNKTVEINRIDRSMPKSERVQIEDDGQEIRCSIDARDTIEVLAPRHLVEVTAWQESGNQGSCICLSNADARLFAHRILKLCDKIEGK